jgi:hypothetical protein
MVAGKGSFVLSLKNDLTEIRHKDFFLLMNVAHPIPNWTKTGRDNGLALTLNHHSLNFR